MKTFKLLGLLLLILQYNANAQSIQLPEFKAPSPDTYALSKYGDIPVGYYTGIPNIDIPIWTIKSGDISVPISVSYHATGIKVDEIASLVGMGWSLNAGGVITRIIRDAPDEPDLTGTALNGKRSDADFVWFENFMSGNPMSTRNTAYYSLVEEVYGKGNSYDNEPDVFYYNFNGKSGKFYFNNDGVPCLYKHENIKITWSKASSIPGQENIKFTILDELGNSYEFDARETNFFDGKGLQVTAWYLTKITSQKGSVISFTYQAYDEQNHERLPRVAIVNANTGSASITGYSNIILEGMPHTELKLSKITTNNGSSADFILDIQNPRLDYPSSSPSYSLKEIIINNTNNTPVSIFAFNTGYFTATDQNSTYPHLNYRLKLNGITQYSGDRTQSKMVSSFSYFGDDASETTLRLPYRLSPSQDHWGYYNGQPNTHLFPGKNSGVTIYQDPVYELRMIGGYTFSGQITNGANRDPNPQLKKSCVLKKIIYPTGGYTEFDYESHIYNGTAVAGLRVLKMTNKNGTTTPIETNYSYSGSCLAVPFDEKSYFTLFHVEPQVFYMNNYGPNLVNSLYNFSADNNIDVNNLSGNYVRIVANPQAVLDGAESSLGYEQVTESKQGNGYTVYSYAAPGGFTSQYNDFRSSEDAQPIVDWFKLQTFYYCPLDDCSRILASALYSTKDWPNLPIYSNEWKRAVLKSKEVYAEGGSTPIHKELYTYNMENSGNVAGYHMARVTVPGTTGSLYEYFIAKYYLPYNWVALNQEHVYDYSSNGTVEQITNYVYNDDHKYRLLNNVVTTNSAGINIETKYRYPSDLNGSIYDAMEGLNMIEYPIEKTQKVNNNIVKSTLTTFRLDQNKYFPDRMYSLNIATPLASFTPFDGSVKDIHYMTDPEIAFDVYDSTGNVLQYHKLKSANTSFFWAYNQTYPVVKAENITSSNLISNVNTAAANSGLNTNTWISDPMIEMSKWQGFNNLLRSYCGPNVMVSTYTYNPLIGMTSQTDPKGMTTYYEYDSFQRLKTIKDQSGNVIKQYNYHYKQ